MVLRPSSLPQSPIKSRGVSPLRNGTMPHQNGYSHRKTGSPNNSKSTTPVRSNSMNNGFRGISPSRSLNGYSRGGGGKSPQRNAPILVRSKGSERGSIDNIASTRSTPNPSTPDDNINVVVRVRPLSQKEVRTGDEMVVQFPGNGQILCNSIPGIGPSAINQQKAKLFSYNVVFEPGAIQDDVLQYSGIKRLIEMAIEGFCCTAFCYGQTGSGKTHTLTGPPELFIGKPNLSDERHGLIFRSFFYLFKLLKEKTDINFVLKASFLEIYNEKVIDLLNPGTSRKPLAVRWSKKTRSFFVENLFTVDCEELDDLLAVLEEGMRNRSVGSHSMNDFSSRSHTILTVHITSEQQTDGGVFISKQGKINFVDLAGSEMSKKTHSEGKTLEEANNINKSLMVLGYCIASLSDVKKRNGHIPYRDSKLTKLLADSLAGNGVTLMIACVSPALSNATETLNTLRYAARAKKIRTKPIIVLDPREALILKLKREMGALEQENEHLRGVLQLNDNNAITNISITPEIGQERIPIPEAPKVDLEKIADLDGSDLTELVKLYVIENQALRNENSDLYTTRDTIMRDQEVVCRENERLLKKLEDVNVVCCRSPIIPAHPTFSAELSNMSTNGNESNLWTNPENNKDMMDGRVSASENRIPDSIQKELDKRKIGESITNIANSLRRNNSWDHSRSSSGNSNRTRAKGSADSFTKNGRFVEQNKRVNSSSSESSFGRKTSGRNNSTKKYVKREFFGSTVSLNEDINAPLFSLIGLEK